MKKAISVLAMSLALAASAHASSATDAAAYEQALGDSFKAMSGVLAEPLGKGLGFAAASQNSSPVAAKPKLGFNIGAGAGMTVTKVDKVAASGASTGGVDLAAYLAQLPDSIPVPLAEVNAHIGLPAFLVFKSLDLGLRTTFLNVADKGTSINLSGFGGEVRGNVIEFPATVTLGLGVESLNTQMRLHKDLASYSSSYGGSAIAGSTGSDLDITSNITVTTLKAVVSRSFVFINPYLGLVFNYNAGDVTVRATQNNQLTFNDGGPTASLSKAIVGQATKQVAPADLRLVGGLEFPIFFFYTALGGEYGLISGGYGGHIQLGFKFR